jgi:hypothetical protein
MLAQGFTYYSVGRAPALPESLPIQGNGLNKKSQNL